MSESVLPMFSSREEILFNVFYSNVSRRPQFRQEIQKNFTNLISNIVKCVSEYRLNAVFIKKES